MENWKIISRECICKEDTSITKPSVTRTYKLQFTVAHATGNCALILYRLELRIILYRVQYRTGNKRTRLYYEESSFYVKYNKNVQINYQVISLNIFYRLKTAQEANKQTNKISIHLVI
jgi:hypothetical protein